MITNYKKYVKELLEQMEFKLSSIYETEDAFSKNKPEPWAVVLYQPEQLKDKNKMVKQWTDDQGTVFIRKQKYERTTVIEITIGDKTQEAVEGHLIEFLKLLETGIDDGEGNFVRIEPKNTKWLTQESVLKSKAGVVLFIEFAGGIYSDEKVTKVTIDNINLKMGGN